MPGPYKADLGTVADKVLAANDMIYLKSSFVHYLKPLIHAGQPKKLSNSSRSSTHSQTLTSSIQQYDHTFSTTIDYSGAFVPPVTSTSSTGSSFNIQKGCGLYCPSTIHVIHKSTDIDGVQPLNHQAESSFNTLLPHHLLHPDIRAPESSYICVPHPSSPRLPYQTFILCEDMSWPPTMSDSGLDDVADLPTEGFAGIPSTMAHSGLPHLAYDSSVHYPLTMSENELLDFEDGGYVDGEASAPNSLGHWKAALHPAEGEEGFTPYLHQQEFDKAEEILDEDNEDVDDELIFSSFQEATSWRSRTRSVNPQSSADPTIPRTLKHKKAAVKLVFKAYKSTALATDNPGMLKAFQEQKHDNRQVETICWSLVEGCIDRCDRGPLLNAYEPDKAKNNPSIKTFADRLDAIVGSLSHQKTICKHLLDAPYLNRFIDDPIGSKQRVESNRKLNKKKGGVMNVGKKALGLTGRKGRPRGSDVGSDDEAEEYKSESQEFRGESSGISSPFKTPDQSILAANSTSGPPSIGINPLYSAERFRSETPTPSSGRRRAGTTTSQTSLRTRALRSPSTQRFGIPGDMSPNIGQGMELSSMSMLPGPMIDPNMPAYAVHLPYGIGAPNGYQSSYNIANNFAAASLVENAGVRLPIFCGICQLTLTNRTSTLRA